MLDGILKRRGKGRKRKDYRHLPCTYADSKAHVQTWVWIDPQTNEDKHSFSVLQYTIKWPKRRERARRGKGSKRKERYTSGLMVM